MRYTALITFIDAETGHEYVAGDVVDTSNMNLLVRTIEQGCRL